MTDHKSPSAAREQWLNRVGAAMVPHIERAAFTATGNDMTFGKWRASCGWPAKGGLPGNKHRVQAQCWDASASATGFAEIFMSPVEADTDTVAAILAHELIHALLGTAIGHRAPFPQIARAMGLGGPPTDTHATPEFWEWARPIVEAAGPYPHDAMTFKGVVKPSKTYLIKVHCEACGYTVRATQKHLDVAVPTCPDFDCPDYTQPMTVDTPAGEPDQ